jgi:hypothetical protein
MTGRYLILTPVQSLPDEKRFDAASKCVGPHYGVF